MHPAFLYLPGGRLSQPELSAARLDGHVVDVGDAYVPADLVESAEVRASTISTFVQLGTAACSQTAAWIHGAGDAPPNVHHVRRCVERRLRPATSHRLVFHDTMVPEDDVQTIGSVPVTVPGRTMLDLATMFHRDPRVLPWMELLAVAVPGAAEAGIARLQNRQRMPGRRAGLALLERLALRTR